LLTVLQFAAIPLIILVYILLSLVSQGSIEWALWFVVENPKYQKLNSKTFNMNHEI
jgi:hypothetical protein